MGKIYGLIKATEFKQENRESKIMYLMYIIY